MGRSWLCSSVAFGALLGAGRGFLGASLQVVHQHAKIALFRLFGATAFPRSLHISVLRGFLGGFFGFIWLRCIFDWLVGFVGLVGLYACRVKRLRSEKRNAANFLGCFALAVALLWLVLCLSLGLLLGLLCSCCLWVSFGLLALFPFG